MISKYRALDRLTGKMFPVGIIDWTIQSVYIKQPNGFYSKISFDEIELMQSTGLFDKNGKEIFEGDVVNFEDAEDLENVYINQGLIEWCQGGFTVTNRTTVTMEDLLDGDNLEVTIIGNIWEGGDLIDLINPEAD